MPSSSPDDRPNRLLVALGARALSVTSQLAERTLTERAERAVAVASGGRTLVVGPGGYATIGAAVAEAQDGDTVLVRPGTYRESVTITRAITIRGDVETEWQSSWKSRVANASSSEKQRRTSAT